MRKRIVASVTLAVVTAAVSIVLSTESKAGGFALREQSVYGQGSSFAGVAAGGALSSMFWNPATMTQSRGFSVEADLAGIIPYASHQVTGGTFAAFGGAGDSADDALVPSGYVAWQATPNFWLGLSFNAPFGLSVSFPNAWAGRNYGQDSELRTYNVTPMLAWRINEWISVGAGVQFQYAKASLTSGITIPPALLSTTLSGNGWGYGAVLGVTLTPWAGGEIGLGWRSAINQDINGTLTAPALPATTPGGVSTTIDLPDTVTFGIRQRLDPQWMVMGTIEWSNWSRIGTSTVSGGAGAALIGGTPVRIPFEYSDGWFFSLGAEYQWTPAFAVRAGIGYEISPIRDTVRTPRLPDNDRLWLSLGATYAVTPNLKFDLAYSHLVVRDTSVAVAPGNPNFALAAGTYFGNVSAHVDILSVALRYSFYTEPPRPKLITK